MREVIPEKLWLGNAADARNVTRILDVGIRAVIDLALEERPGGLVRELVCCRFPLIDGASLVTYDDVALPDYDSTPTFDDEARKSSEEIFPDRILGLDGEKVAMDGFMLPLDFENKAITAFVLNPYPPGCCYGGAMPRMDEWIEVEVEDPDGCPYYAYRVVRVTGTLEVGEVIDAYGYVTSVYRIQADDVTCLL